MFKSYTKLASVMVMRIAEGGALAVFGNSVFNYYNGTQTNTVAFIGSAVLFALFVASGKRDEESRNAEQMKMLEEVVRKHIPPAPQPMQAPEALVSDKADMQPKNLLHGRLNERRKIRRRK